MRLTEKPDKKPWMPLWAKDWLAADAGLRMCGLAARGLWIDVLAHMWLRTPRGILTANLDALVNLIGGERETIRAALAELTLHRVHSWYLDGEVSDRYTPESELCCRRMYREWRAKEIQRESGSRGGRERARKAGQNLKATPKARPRLPPRLGQGYPQGSGPI